jgi:uroporphyrin-III C-methyltransferase
MRARETPGKVYLVGAGPGAPDLLTLRAARLLAQADVVLYDALVHPEVVALAANAKLFPVGKRCKQLSTDQRFINRLLVESALRHAVVVRLKGGDPMLFSRAREEIDTLDAAGIEYEIVPGITAALAAAAELKTPLTERGVSRSVTFATPRFGAESQAHKLADAVPGATLVLYMAVGEAEKVAASLLRRGLAPETPVAIVENASLPNARCFHTILARLPSFDASNITGPAIVCVGEVLRHAGAQPTAHFQALASQG